MTVQFPSFDKPFGLSGGADAWDGGPAGAILSDDFFGALASGPVITVQPTDQTASSGGTATFSFTGTDYSTAQWQTSAPTAFAQAEIIGTPTNLAIGTSATPGAQSITVPADAEGVLFFWSAYAFDLSSLTSNFTDTFTLVQTGNNGLADGVGVAYARVTSTGSKTVTPVWGGAQTNGPVFWSVFVKNIPTSGAWVRGYDDQHSPDDPSAPLAGNVASTPTDVVIAYDAQYLSTVPAAEAGWTSLGTLTLNNYNARLSKADSPGASTTSFSGNGTAYPVLSLVSIISRPAGFGPWTNVSTGTGGTTSSWTTGTLGTIDNGYKVRALLNGSLATNEVTLTVSAGGATQTLNPGLFTNTQSFYSPTVALAGGGSQSLTAARFDNANTFFAPAVTTGPVALAPGLFTNAQSFFAAVVAPGPVSIAPPLTVNNQSFFGPSVSPGPVTLAPGLFTNAQSFFSPTVSTGPVALTPGLLTNAQTFYSATVSLGGGGSQSLTATRFDNSNTFFAHTVSPGAVTLLPNLLANSQSFYAPAVSVGVVVLSPELLANANTFFSATVSLGGGAPQNLGPSLFSNSNAFFGPAVSVGPVSLLPGRLDNSNAFFGPAVLPGAVTLSPGLLAGTNSFFALTVQSVASLAPGLLVNANAFYGPTVTRGAVTIAPALLVNSNAFFNALLDGAQYTLTAAQAQKLHQIYLLHGLKAGSPLTVGPNARSAGGLEQTLTGSDPVTVHTTDIPIVGGLDVGLMIEELAALHGLGVDLTVTPTSRTAGSIEQSLQLQGASTVVTRL